MSFRQILLLVLIFGTSCRSSTEKNQSGNNSEQFDEVRWQQRDGDNYLYRNAMLKNLMTDSVIRRMKKDQLMRTLGVPEKADSNFLFYRIEQTRLGVLPLHTKTLVIKFKADSSVEWMKIHE